MSQPIAVSCPHCRAQFAVQDPRLIGQQVRCPGCSQPFVVSPPTQTPQAPQTLGGVAGAAASQVPVQQSPAPGAYVQPPQTPPGVQPQQPDPLAMPGGDPLAMPGSDPLAAPHDPLAAPHDPLAAPHDPLAAPVGQTQRPLAGRGGYGYQGKKKSNWQKPALIGGGVVLGLAMLIMLISLLTGGSARRGGDGNIVDMTYLPANSEMVAFVDVQRLVRSSMVRDQIANDPKAAQAIKEMEEETGLTPQDVASITFGGALEGNSAVAVVRLLKDFDTSKLGNMPVEEINGSKVYSQGNGRLMVCDPRTLVLGEGNAVTEAAQRGAQKQRFEKFDFVNSKQDMFFCWVPNDISQLRQAAGKAPPVGMMAGAPDGTAEAMAALQNNVIAVAGGGTLSGNDLDLSVQVNTDDSSASGDLATGLKSLISEGRSQYDTMKGLIPQQIRGVADEVVNSLAVNRSGKAVALNLTLPTVEMQQAMQSQMGGGMPGPTGNMFSGLKNPLDGLGNFGGLGDGLFGRGSTPPPSGLNPSMPSPNAGASVTGSASAVSSARMAAQRMKNTNNLKQLGLALHNHHSVHRSFPPAKDQNPGLSWRVHILPYLEERALYEKFNLDEPWDSPTNRALLMQMPKVYQADGIQTPAGKTIFLGAATTGAVFADPQKGSSFREILDGTSNTAMIVMATPALAVEWTKPADYAPPGGPPTGLFPYSTNQSVVHPIAFCDGSVINLSPTLATPDWQNIFNCKDGNIVEFR